MIALTFSLTPEDGERIEETVFVDLKELEAVEKDVTIHTVTGRQRVTIGVKFAPAVRIP